MDDRLDAQVPPGDFDERRLRRKRPYAIETDVRVRASRLRGGPDLGQQPPQERLGKPEGLAHP